MRLSTLLIAAILILSVLSGCAGSNVHVISPTPPQTEVTEPPKVDSDVLRPDPSDISAFRLSETERSALETLAGIRSDLELPELTTDETLCALAYIRAKEVYTSFTHIRPDGRSYDTVFEDYGYEIVASAEVRMSSDTPMSMEEFFSVWNIDPTVAQKLTDPTFLRVGIAFYHKGNHDIMVCLLVK